MALGDQIFTFNFESFMHTYSDDMNVTENAGDISENGKYFIIGEQPDKAHIHIFDLENFNQRVFYRELGTESIGGALFCNNDNHFIFEYNGTIYIYEVSTFSELATISTEGTYLRSLDKKGVKILSIASNSPAKVIDVSTQTVLLNESKSYNFHSGAIEKKDGNSIIINNDDSDTVEIINISDGSILETHEVKMNNIYDFYDDYILFTDHNDNFKFYDKRIEQITDLGIQHNTYQNTTPYREVSFFNGGDYFACQDDVYRTRDLTRIYQGSNNGNQIIDEIGGWYWIDANDSSAYLKIFEGVNFKENVYFKDWKNAKKINRTNFLTLNFQLPEIIIGNTDEIREVQFVNGTPVNIENVTVSKANLPTGIDIKFSKTLDPFDNLDTLNWATAYSQGQGETFYIQFSSTTEATTGLDSLDLKIDYDFSN